MESHRPRPSSTTKVRATEGGPQVHWPFNYVCPRTSKLPPRLYSSDKKWLRGQECYIVCVCVWGCGRRAWHLERVGREVGREASK